MTVFLNTTHSGTSHQNAWNTRGGGGYLAYLSDGDVPFFRVSFSPIFSKTGSQNTGRFLEHLVKTCKKGKFC